MKLSAFKPLSVVLVLLLAGVLLITGCSSNDGGGGEPGVAAGAVDEVSLTGTAGEADFESFSTLYTLPSDKGGDEKAVVLESAGNAIGLLGYALSSFFEENPNWEPSSGSFQSSPANLEDFETASSISIDASMSNESVNLNFVDSYGEPFEGGATMWATFDMDATKSDAIDGDGYRYIERVTGSAGLTGAQISFDNVAAPDDYDFYYIESLGGRVFLAANANVDVNPHWRTGDYGLEMYAMDAGFGVSVAISAALTVDDDRSNSKYAGGNYLVQASYLDTATLQITEALLNDSTALGEYLEGALDGGDFSLTISVYDDTPNEVASYTYTIDWLTNYFETQEQIQ